MTDVSFTLRPPHWCPSEGLQHGVNTNKQLYKFGWNIIPNNTGILDFIILDFIFDGMTAKTSNTLTCLNTRTTATGHYRFGIAKWVEGQLNAFRKPNRTLFWEKWENLAVTLFTRLTEMSTSEPTVAILSCQGYMPFTIWRLMENGQNTVLHFKARQSIVNFWWQTAKLKLWFEGSGKHSKLLTKSLYWLTLTLWRRGYLVIALELRVRALPKTVLILVLGRSLSTLGKSGDGKAYYLIAVLAPNGQCSPSLPKV